MTVPLKRKENVVAFVKCEGPNYYLELRKNLGISEVLASSGVMIGISWLSTALSRPHRFLPTQRQEILRALDRFRYFPQQLLQVFIAVDEIDLRSVDD